MKKVITINLTEDEAQYLNEVLAIDVEKNLTRLERNIDVEENNITKINAGRTIQTKLLDEKGEENESVLGLDEGIEDEIDDEEFEEVEFDEFEQDVLEVLDKIYGQCKGEDFAEEIAANGYTLEAYVDLIAESVEYYFYKQNIYKELEDEEFDMLVDICYDYLVSYDDVVDLFDIG